MSKLDICRRRWDDGHLSFPRGDVPSETLETEVTMDPEAETAAPVSDPPPADPVEELAPADPAVTAAHVIPEAALPVTAAPDYQRIVDWKNNANTSLHFSILIDAGDPLKIRVGPVETSEGRVHSQAHVIIPKKKFSF